MLLSERTAKWIVGVVGIATLALIVSALTATAQNPDTARVNAVKVQTDSIRKETCRNGRLSASGLTCTATGTVLAPRVTKLRQWANRIDSLLRLPPVVVQPPQPPAFVAAFTISWAGTTATLDCRSSSPRLASCAWHASDPSRADKTGLQITRGWGGSDLGYTETLTATDSLGRIATTSHQIVGPPGGGTVPPVTQPPPVVTDTTGIGQILSLLGPTKTVTEARAMGGAFARYDTLFTQYLPSQNEWGDNYYDRGVVYYARYARTGDKSYRAKADSITLKYRKQYLEPNNYGVQPHNSVSRGLELHYRLTGDTLSRRAVAGMFAMGGVNFTILRSNGKAEIEDTAIPYMDNRIQARVLQQLLASYRMGATFVRGDGYGGAMNPTTWPTRLRDALTRILSTQKPDGSYGWIQVCGGQLNYMVGMLNDVLIEYWNTFEQDVRIPGAVERANEYLWTTQWKAADQAFSYASVFCDPNSFGAHIGGPDPAGDLNGLLISSFGWLAKQTGNSIWRTRGDAIMAGLVAPRWASNYTGSKQFNQAFVESYRYLGWR